jgi:hypothetical protein
MARVGSMRFDGRGDRLAPNVDSLVFANRVTPEPVDTLFPIARSPFCRSGCGRARAVVLM